MNVINPQVECVHLYEICGGGLFEFRSKLFMRAVVPASLTLDELSLKERPTCIEVRTGKLATIGWNAFVIPVEADLVIRSVKE